jgi:hypothetical protein
MLQQFTWGQFLLFSFVLSFLWYAFVLLVCFRKELSVFFGRGSDRGPAPLPHHWEKGVESLEEREDFYRSDDAEESLMGKSILPEGMAVVGMGQLAFAGGSDGRYDQVGMVADVIQELKGIFADLEKQGGSKMDFFRRLENVKENYGRIGAHPSIGAINGFISMHAPFHLSAEELNNLWY